MRVTSEMSAQTASGGAAIARSTITLSLMSLLCPWGTADCEKLTRSTSLMAWTADGDVSRW